MLFPPCKLKKKKSEEPGTFLFLAEYHFFYTEFKHVSLFDPSSRDDFDTSYNALDWVSECTKCTQPSDAKEFIYMK